MRDDPLGDGRIKRAGMIQGGGSVIFNSIIVDTNDNITRDNKLFEEIFGYKSGELTSVSVTKYFSDKSVIDYFETYGKLLEQQGFKEVRSEFWRKIDYKNGIIYSWSYTVEGDGKSPLMSASWEYEPYNLYSAINTLTQR
jgi:PAS domain S-box-containing protein